MLKMNNKGFELTTMLVIMCLIMFIILLVAVLSMRYENANTNRGLLIKEIYSK